MKITQFKAVILDMDGVFIDTETFIFDIFRRVFAPYNISPSNEYQYKFIGQPFSSNLVDIRKDFGIDFDDNALRQQFDDTYEEMLHTSSLDVQDGIKDIINQVKKHHQKLGLCTTSTRHHVDAVFARVKIKSFDPTLLFDAVVTGDSVTHRKPHAEPYLRAAEKLGESPKDCFVIEDSLSGITSAKAAGCFCAGLRQAYNRHIDFSAADVVIERLEQVLA